MVDYKVSLRYASSLLGVAEEKNILQKSAGDAELVKKTLAESSELKRVLKNPVIRPQTKISILEKIFKPFVHPEIMNFLEFIVDKNREALLYDIFYKYLELYDERLGIVNVNVKTPFEFDNEQKEKLKNQLEDYLNKEARFNFEIDKEIIGGFIAKVGDTVYDASLKRQLNLLRKQFLSGSTSLN